MYSKIYLKPSAVQVSQIKRISSEKFFLVQHYLFLFLVSNLSFNIQRCWLREEYVSCKFVEYETKNYLLSSVSVVYTIKLLKQPKGNYFLVAPHSTAHQMAAEDNIFSALQHRSCLVGLHREQTLTNLMVQIQNCCCDGKNSLLLHIKTLHIGVIISTNTPLLIKGANYI